LKPSEKGGKPEIEIYLQGLNAEGKSTITIAYKQLLAEKLIEKKE
jgi:hypothetical protein